MNDSGENKKQTISDLREHRMEYLFLGPHKEDSVLIPLIRARGEGDARTRGEGDARENGERSRNRGDGERRRIGLDGETGCSGPDGERSYIRLEGETGCSGPDGELSLIQAEEEWGLLFEVRAGSIVQGGEICFPGGGRNPGETGEETAVRETMEELRVSRDQIDVVCPMFRLVGPGGADITSYLGILNHYEGTFSKDEVSRVFFLPLSWFRDHPAKEYRAELVTKPGEDFPYDELPGGHQYPFRRVPRVFYFYETEYGPLWGMTAQIVHAALPLLLEDNIDGV